MGYSDSGQNTVTSLGVVNASYTGTDGAAVGGDAKRRHWNKECRFQYL